ncbi:MAG TPA: fumarylacetoacetate hydrolase family protein [Pedobacter sp.]|uniref:fumarylacetoacetate hydrolase family protein n=1 Tax=Pedobacter sp. TaxID=1411316 RepID=UPI002CC77A4D|nr:fumarylacetoacetate hydrolase family protein [Pedobacter sp.]HMI01877.1 fumarylacetoacetate hydrolase family protein [Pedobacter sp.]
MKLFRFGEKGAEKPGIFFENKMLDVSSFGEDYNEQFFESGGLKKLAGFIEKNQDKLPVVPSGSRFGSAVGRPSKIICIGLNYKDHALESGAKIPDEPIVFFKSTTAICGPDDDLVLPKDSLKTDWEVELAVVIAKEASYVEEKEAMNYVAGYVLHNDYSERSFQLERGGQWVKGKSCDTFAPLGPYLVTPDEIADVQGLKLWLKVNGETVQQGSTSQMIFSVSFLIHYLSQFMTLLPGDIISTGTPAGVGLGFSPPKYLKAGDLVELGIDNLGVSKQKVVAYTPKINR